MAKPPGRKASLGLGRAHKANYRMDTDVKAELITAMYKRNRKWRNRMRESRSYGSVGERGGNELLYLEKFHCFLDLAAFFSSLSGSFCFSLFPKLLQASLLCN